MYKALKFTETEETRLFFTSDTHFCHDRDFIWGLRGYKSVEDMNEGLIKGWNEVVRPTDTIVHLGDFLLGAGNNSYKRFKEILARLNGNIIYLWGNHNAGVSEFYKENFLARFNFSDEEYHVTKPEYYPLTVNTPRGGTFTFRGNNLFMQIKTLDGCRQTVFCAHFAHRLWIDSHKGKFIHLCGHSHGSDLESQPNYTLDKRLDVGVDNFGDPISIEDVMALMKNKKVRIIDHHNENTNPS